MYGLVFLLHHFIIHRHLAKSYKNSECVNTEMYCLPQPRLQGTQCSKLKVQTKRVEQI